MAALEPRFFAEALALFGLPPEWLGRQHDRSAWPALREALASAIRGHTRAHWAERAAAGDACVAPVLEFHEAPLHAHAQARGAFVQVDGRWQPAPSPRFGRTPAAAPGGAPAIGEHTDTVLAEAGLDVAALRAAGALG